MIGRARLLGKGGAAVSYGRCLVEGRGGGVGSDDGRRGEAAMRVVRVEEGHGHGVY